MAEQKCEFCGATLKDCGSWHKCPLSFEPVCDRCHESCQHLKIYNGYLEHCMKRDKPEKA